MTRDPRTIRPSEWRAESPPRITSTRDYVADIIRRAPLLAGAGLESLKDSEISRVDHPEAYTAVNTSRLTDAVARVLTSFTQRGGIDPQLLPELATNLSRENTAFGYAAQLRGYDWLIREGARFIPEVKHLATLRGRQITLDGRFDEGCGGAAFFDIKSYSFEPHTRAAFQRALESRVPQTTITISGPGNHGPDIISRHAFGRLKEYVKTLKRSEIVRIEELGWTIVAKPRRGIATSEAEYNPLAIAHEHRLLPLWWSSQFVVDAPYVLTMVIPYGFGGTGFGLNVFGSSVEVFDRIASYVFGPGSTDAGAAKLYDSQMPAGITVRDAVACLSGLALISEPGADHPSTARIYLNAGSRHPLTREQALTISPSWTVMPQT